MFKNRSTGELLVIMVAITVCGYVFISIIVTLLLAFFTDRDVTAAARNITDIINTLIGLLAGYLAGRTDSALMKRELEQYTNQQPPKESK
jgi:hypothetical protein